MVLLNVSLYGKEGRWDVKLDNGSIDRILNHGQSWKNEQRQIEANGALLLPGIVNSHDHLDFNSYPRLANRKYQNYKEWGEDIQLSNQESIARVRKIPLSLRVRWGMYKNLLNGFTTVVNHGNKLDIQDGFVEVLQDHPSIHSVSFEKNWKRRLRNPFGGSRAFVMHLGEGIDQMAKAEINEVIKTNIFRKKIIVVHGVMMDADQAACFAGLIWCPSSNYFLFGQTANIPSLLGKTTVVFGTDSTLTSTWNAWEQFREALKGNQVSEEELMHMLTGQACSLFNLRSSGKIVKGQKDLLLLRNNQSVFNSNPKDILLVLRDGMVRMIDPAIGSQVETDRKGFSRIRMGGSEKWVEGNLNELVTQMKAHYPELSVPFELIHD